MYVKMHVHSRAVLCDTLIVPVDLQLITKFSCSNIRKKAVHSETKAKYI